MSTSRWAYALVPYVLLILLLTLLPIGVNAQVDLSGCLICGERGVADALLNILLFIPFGAILRFSGIRTRRVLLLAACLSLFIEISQIFLPGRDPSLGDFLFNTLGGGVGSEIGCRLSVWSFATGERAGRLSLASALVALFLWIITASLLQPALPETPYGGQFSPDLGDLDHYQGKVLEADVGGLEIVYGELEDSDSVRRLLLSGAPFSVRVVTGPLTRWVAPIVRIHHEWAEEAATIAADRLDLVYRYRTRAATLLLDQPDLRSVGVFANISVGDTVEAKVMKESGSYFLQIDGIVSPPLGFTVGHGWTLLMYVEEFPQWIKQALNALWVTLLLIPMGYWAVRRWEFIGAGLVVIGGLSLLPIVTVLQVTPPGEYLGAVAGVAFGRVLRALVSTLS